MPILRTFQSKCPLFELDFDSYILCLIILLSTLYCIIILNILQTISHFRTFCKHFASTFTFYTYHISSNISWYVLFSSLSLSLLSCNCFIISSLSLQHVLPGLTFLKPPYLSSGYILCNGSNHIT